MKRIWSVEESVVEDPVTKTRLEFSSLWTDEVNAGNEPPDRDDVVVLRLWSSDRSRVAMFQFERGGGFVRSDIEPAAIPVPDLVSQAEAAYTKDTYAQNYDAMMVQKTDNAAMAMEIQNGGPRKEKLVTLREFE